MPNTLVVINFFEGPIALFKLSDSFTVDLHFDSSQTIEKASSDPSKTKPENHSQVCSPAKRYFTRPLNFSWIVCQCIQTI